MSRRPAEREIEAMRLMAAGLTDEAIAEQMIIQPSTVEVYRYRYMKRNGLHSRAGVIEHVRRPDVKGEATIMHRLHLATQALQIRDGLPPIGELTEDLMAATAALCGLANTCNSYPAYRNPSLMHKTALQLAAHALRLAEWAEGVGE